MYGPTFWNASGSHFWCSARHAPLWDRARLRSAALTRLDIRHRESPRVAGPPRRDRLDCMSCKDCADVKRAP
jgi:hypothetical protein